jgi:hypothetical protein
VRLVLPAERPHTPGGFASVAVSVAIREDVEELLQRALRFVAWVLDRIDPIQRISDVVPVVNLSGALGWRTRVEHERSPNSFTMRMSQEPATVFLTPARRQRVELPRFGGRVIAFGIIPVTALSSRRLWARGSRGPSGGAVGCTSLR